MKRAIFWVLLAAFAAAAAWWTFHVPHRPDQLYRAIPANATWLGAHHRLAARWPDTAGHPVIEQIAERFGGGAEAWQTLQKDPVFQQLIDVLGGDELLLAHVPRLRTTGEPAWVFSAWVGGASVRARWMLGSVRSPELQPAATRNGWRVWVWTPKAIGRGPFITFALVEGMLVGCIAEQTLGIDDVIACVDGYADSLAGDPGARAASPATRPDRGWYLTPDGSRLPFSFSLHTNGTAALEVAVPLTVPAALAAPAATNATLHGYGALVREHPVAVAALDRSLVRDSLIRRWPGPWSAELRALLDDAGPGPLALGLLGGDYAGRFMAVRLPSLVGGVASAHPERQLAAVPAALDRINAATRWGLVQEELLAGTSRYAAIESTGRSVYARVARDERLAYAARGDSLVFASNASVLARLLREAGETPVATAPTGLVEGLDKLGRGDLSAFLWFDAREGARAARVGLTAWSLKLLVEDAAGSQAFRQQLNHAKAWLETIAPLGQVRLGLSAQDGRAVLYMETGPRS